MMYFSSLLRLSLDVTRNVTGFILYDLPSVRGPSRTLAPPCLLIRFGTSCLVLPAAAPLPRPYPRTPVDPALDALNNEEKKRLTT
jgi:hypothetical protein